MSLGAEVKKLVKKVRSIDPKLIFTPKEGQDIEYARDNGYEWVDRGEYLESVHLQRSPGWHAQRLGRCSSTMNTVLFGTSNYKLPIDGLDSLTGRSKEEFSDYSKMIMQHGTDAEPVARNWYKSLVESCGSDVISLRDPGLCVRKEDTFFGASPDGIIDLINEEGELEQGCIEIKCPLRMYEGLIEYSHGGHPRAHLDSPDYDKFYSEHIKLDHYLQMQQHMYVTGRKWCDYIVFVISPENLESGAIIPDDVNIVRVVWNPGFHGYCRKKISELVA